MLARPLRPLHLHLHAADRILRHIDHIFPFPPTRSFITPQPPKYPESYDLNTTILIKVSFQLKREVRRTKRPNSTAFSTAPSAQNLVKPHFRIKLTNQSTSKLPINYLRSATL
jgi:hypothetical protein